MTEVEKSRVILKIDELKKEKVNQKKRLDSARSNNSFAWGIYGSELAGGAMENQEIGIQATIMELGLKIILLQNLLEKDDSYNPREELSQAETELKNIEVNISSLEEEKKAFLSGAGDLTYIIKVCDGKH